MMAIRSKVVADRHYERRSLPLLLTAGVLCLSGACLQNPVAIPPPSGLELAIHADTADLFDGAPIYLVLELQNRSDDTAWVNVFSFPALTLHGTVHGGDGTEFDDWGIVADVIHPPGWRGTPVPPGESLFELTLLQDRWGKYDSLLRNLYANHHFPLGTYELRVAFSWNPHPLPGRVALFAHSAGLSVVPRGASEDSAFNEVVQLAALALDSAARPAYLDSVLVAIDRTAAKGSANALLPWMATRLIITAEGLGYPPDSAQRARLGFVLEAVAEGRAESPVGAYAVKGVYRYSPSRMTSLAGRLGSSLAGRYAATLLSPQARTR